MIKKLCVKIGCTNILCKIVGICTSVYMSFMPEYMQYSGTNLVSFFKIQIYYITFGGRPHRSYSSFAWLFFTSKILKDLIFGRFQNPPHTLQDRMNAYNILFNNLNTRQYILLCHLMYQLKNRNLVFRIAHFE